MPLCLGDCSEYRPGGGKLDFRGGAFRERTSKEAALTSCLSYALGAVVSTFDHRSKYHQYLAFTALPRPTKLVGHDLPLRGEEYYCSSHD
ncbi:hypothetical protein HKBW3S47_01960, partial [Candidatus Hakubella thermalkaliphila]